uniref:PhoD-like phosphatase domain-containing protein n=1 Tax=Aggregicoccus edonensis TaxID=1450165 RepID=A0A3S7UV93_9BACT|nr:hypothetical protein [Aggregicoccus edonensis]
MKRLLGPVLYAESQPDPNLWSFRLNLYLHGGDGGPPPFSLTFTEKTPTGPQPVNDITVSAPKKAADFSTLVDPNFAGIVWSWRIEVPRRSAPRVLTYRIASTAPSVPFTPIEVPEVFIPAQAHLPRIAFFSCNGAPNASELHGRDPLALWEKMLDEHQRMVSGKSPDGFGLLIGGGDQIYADSLFNSPHDFPLLWKFARKLSNKERMLLRLGEDWEPLRARVLAGYVRLYCDTWGEGSGTSEMLARVPGLFTWDDHDILDGWGSLELLQECDVYRMLYPEAARAFEAFQLGREGYSGQSLPSPVPKDKPTPHYFQSLSFAGKERDLEVVALDSRSGRTDTRVLDDEQWARFDVWRRADIERSKAAPGHKRHVIVITSVPMVFRRFSPQMELMASTAIGIRDMGLRDDMLDQWESRLHRAERARMLRNLLSHVREARCAVTIVAGDVHVGAHGRIHSREPGHLVDGRRETIIEQVVSSGIVHPAVGGLTLLGMDIASSISPDRSLGAQIETRLELLDNGGVVLSERNWLDIQLENAARAELRLQWYAEESGRVPTKIVVTPP